MKNQSIFIFCFFTSLYAQDISIPNEIDLKTSVQFALKNHPQINEAQYQKEINVQRLKQGKSNYYPKLDSIYGYKKNFSQLRNETPLEKKQFYAGLEISQKVYDFGRTSDNVKILNENVEVATKILEQTKEEIAFKTISSYVSVLIQNYQLKVSEEKKNYYSKYRDFIKKQVEVGLKAPFELYNIETEYRNAEIEWIQSKNQSNLAKNQLLFYMGFEQTEPGLINQIKIKEIQPEELESSFNKEKIHQYALNDIQDIYQIALVYRKDYQIQQKEIHIAKLTKELNTNDYFPTLGASFQHYWNSPDYRLNDIQQKNWELNVFFRVPLFEGFMTKNKVLEADYFVRQQLEKERWIKNQIYLELQTLFSQYTELKEKITYYQEALRYAKENLNLSEKRYINGLGTYLELTNATTLYFNANKNYYDNIFLFYLKKLELYKAMGVLLELL